MSNHLSETQTDLERVSQMLERLGRLHKLLPTAGGGTMLEIRAMTNVTLQFFFDERGSLADLWGDADFAAIAAAGSPAGSPPRQEKP
jgi:hypothetical protein